MSLAVCGRAEQAKLASHTSDTNLFKITEWAAANSESSFAWTGSILCGLVWPLRLGSNALAHTAWSIFWDMFNLGHSKLFKMDEKPCKNQLSVGLGPVRSAAQLDRSKAIKAIPAISQSGRLPQQGSCGELLLDLEARRQPRSCMYILQRCLILDLSGDFGPGQWSGDPVRMLPSRNVRRVPSTPSTAGASEPSAPCWPFIALHRAVGAGLVWGIAPGVHRYPFVDGIRSRRTA